MHEIKSSVWFKQGAITALMCSAEKKISFAGEADLAVCCLSAMGLHYKASPLQKELAFGRIAIITMCLLRSATLLSSCCFA